LKGIKSTQVLIKSRSVPEKLTLEGLLPKSETGSFHAEELTNRGFLRFFCLIPVCQKYTQLFLQKAKSHLKAFPIWRRHALIEIF